jgi:thymidine phosphorylase
VVVIDVDAEAEKEQKKKRKNATVVTGRMNTNLTIRMGQMHELKESMDFLERMRPLIGEKEFAAKAIVLMTCLPNPNTYRKEVTRSSFDVTASTIKSEPDEEEEDGEDE